MTKVEHSLFEDGFLVSSIGQIAQKPEVAIAELVANAWDAGASRVDIDIPANLSETITVADDGVGLTPQQFRERWMRLGYRRVKHQGDYAEFPPERATWRRRAYGRNGAGRHGMLCFAPQYKVLSKRYDSKKAHEFTVTRQRRKRFPPAFRCCRRACRPRHDGLREARIFSAEVGRNLPFAIVQVPS